MPTTVNVQTGQASATIKVGNKFVWTSSSACTVSTPSGASNAWFTPSYPSTVSVPADGNSAEVTAAIATPVGSTGWPYLVDGNTPSGNPKVPISSSR